MTPAIKRQILGHNAIELFGIRPPATPCPPAEPSGLRATNRTYGPVSRRDIVTTFVNGHPWVRRPGR